jgi:hypothetical protein
MDVSAANASLLTREKYLPLVFATRNLVILTEEFV